MITSPQCFSYSSEMSRNLWQCWHQLKLPYPDCRHCTSWCHHTIAAGHLLIWICIRPWKDMRNWLSILGTKDTRCSVTGKISKWLYHWQGPCRNTVCYHHDQRQLMDWHYSIRLCVTHSAHILLPQCNCHQLHLGLHIFLHIFPPNQRIPWPHQPKCLCSPARTDSENPKVPLKIQWLRIWYLIQLNSMVNSWCGQCRDCCWRRGSTIWLSLQPHVPTCCEDHLQQELHVHSFLHSGVHKDEEGEEACSSNLQGLIQNNMEHWGTNAMRPIISCDHL